MLMDSQLCNNFNAATAASFNPFPLTRLFDHLAGAGEQRRRLLGGLIPPLTHHAPLIIGYGSGVGAMSSPLLPMSQARGEISFPPPALSEGRHCRLACLGIAVRRRAILVVPKASVHIHDAPTRAPDAEESRSVVPTEEGRLFTRA
jgi:hypothetical protein